MNTVYELTVKLIGSGYLNFKALDELMLGKAVNITGSPNFLKVNNIFFTGGGKTSLLL
jgi:hypothetical protein